MTRKYKLHYSEVRGDVLQPPHGRLANVGQLGINIHYENTPIQLYWDYNHQNMKTLR